MRGSCGERDGLDKIHRSHPGRARRQAVPHRHGITPTDILEYLAGGMAEDEILRDFPSLTRDHIRAVLAYAAERERRCATRGVA